MSLTPSHQPAQPVALTRLMHMGTDDYLDHLRELYAEDAISIDQLEIDTAAVLRGQRPSCHDRVALRAAYAAATGQSSIMVLSEGARYTWAGDVGEPETY